MFVSNNGTNGVISGTVSAVTTTSLALNAHVLTSQTLAQSAVDVVTSAVVDLGKVQGAVGSIQNRLNFASDLARNLRRCLLQPPGGNVPDRLLPRVELVRT